MTSPDPDLLPRLAVRLLRSERWPAYRHTGAGFAHTGFVHDTISCADIYTVHGLVCVLRDSRSSLWRSGLAGADRGIVVARARRGRSDLGPEVLDPKLQHLLRLRKPARLVRIHDVDHRSQEQHAVLDPDEPPVVGRGARIHGSVLKECGSCGTLLEGAPDQPAGGRPRLDAEVLVARRALPRRPVGVHALLGELGADERDLGTYKREATGRETVGCHGGVCQHHGGVRQHGDILPGPETAEKSVVECPPHPYG
jgi:hypothetical protein